MVVLDRGEAVRGEVVSGRRRFSWDSALGDRQRIVRGPIGQSALRGRSSQPPARKRAAQGFGLAGSVKGRAHALLDEAIQSRGQLRVIGLPAEVIFPARSPTDCIRRSALDGLLGKAAGLLARGERLQRHRRRHGLAAVARDDDRLAIRVDAVDRRGEVSSEFGTGGYAHDLSRANAYVKSIPGSCVINSADRRLTRNPFAPPWRSLWRRPPQRARRRRRWRLTRAPPPPPPRPPSARPRARR